MALQYVRSGEVDTPEEVSSAFRKVIDAVNTNERKIEQMASSNQIPAAGEIVVISEDGNFYPGVVSECLDDGLFEVEFFDGDSGCYGVEDLACNAENKKGAKDA